MIIWCSEPIYLPTAFSAFDLILPLPLWNNRFCCRVAQSLQLVHVEESSNLNSECAFETIFDDPSASVARHEGPPVGLLLCSESDSRSADAMTDTGG